MDFVSHGGTSMQGVFLWSLVATDVASGWTEMVPLVALKGIWTTSWAEVAETTVRATP